MKIEELKNYIDIKSRLDLDEQAKRTLEIALAAISDYEDAEKVDENGLKGCDFCGGRDLDYSMKKNGGYGSGHYYHCTIYCKGCRAYGPRVLSDKFAYGDYQKARESKASAQARELAIKAWNTRPQTKAGAAIARIVGE